MLKEKNDEPCFPDYSDSILNLSNSILNYYGVKPFHETLPGADYLLSKNFPHVVLILLDGLGMNILERNLSYRDFLRRNLYSDYSSVFPPTTTASTTTVLSGLSPAEHGWLGWDVYFKQEDKNVCCFLNTIQGTEEPAADYSVARKYLPYKNIIDLINESGKAEANAIFPFGENAYSEMHDWIRAIKESVNTPKRTFTYAYWESPDYELHRQGNRSNDVMKIINDLNAEMAYLCETTKDTLFLITADHGHEDIQNIFLQEDYPEIANMLERPCSMEPRAISFFVKDEYKDQFVREFNDKFSKDYLLFTKEEALEKELFGPGKLNENSTGIGDFVAAAISYRTILWNKNCHQFKSHHAGLRKEEMRIPLIWYGKKTRKNLGSGIFLTVIGCIVLFLIYIMLA
ncbi:MAG: alkaline phosphatase family protein [Treponema sp.]|nr:alkaline phosphatase family protein [Treponema sp.]